MAYINQEKKAEIVSKAKPICKQYGLKATFGVHHYSTLVVNISSGKIDFIESYNRIGEKRANGSIFQKQTNYMDINEFHYKELFDGPALDFLSALIPILNNGNHNNSDIQTDYFDVGWYVNINIGKWNKPYLLVS